MARLDGRAAIATGCSGGIGRATALAFAREAADVTGADVHGENPKTGVDQVRRGP